MRAIELTQIVICCFLISTDGNVLRLAINSHHGTFDSTRMKSGVKIDQKIVFASRLCIDCLNVVQVLQMLLRKVSPA